jgi:exonuclease III
MNNTPRRTWNILNWNIRGINSDDKCNAVHAKIEESSCSVFCIQETKRQSFDPSMVRKMAPRRFNKFTYAPSQGASWGIFVGWNGSIFEGSVVSINSYAIIIQFIATQNAEMWFLVVVYGPCNGQQRQDFIDLLNNLQIPDHENWMIIGDFNFYRSTQCRNRGGGNMQDIMTFNGVISNLGL